MVQHLNTPALKKQWVLDAQWTDCPPEIVDIVKALWAHHGLANDVYMLRHDLRYYQSCEDDGFECEVFRWGDTKEEQKGWVKEPMSLKPLIEYIKSAGIPEDEEFIIHWWW
jgi:hypothetical protein